MSVQLENGYTRIANELLEQLILYKLNASQLKIVFTIIRYTYGFNRKSHNLSLTFLSKATGISKRYVSSELSKLIEENVVLIIQEHTDTQSRELQLNKDYKNWKSNSNVPQVNNTSTGEELNNTTDEQLFHTTDEQSFHQERQTKDKYKDSSVYDDFVKELLPFYPGVKSKSVRDKKLPKILKEYGHERVIACVKNYAATVKGVEKKFILHESTFWNTRYIDFMVDEKGIEPKRPPVKKVYRENI